jgi:hypothetical protein
VLGDAAVPDAAGAAVGAGWQAAKMSIRTSMAIMTVLKFLIFSSFSFFVLPSTWLIAMRFEIKKSPPRRAFDYCAGLRFNAN